MQDTITETGKTLAPLAPRLPNVRKLFAPDPGYVLLDCDLKGADAQVVAWEANDNDLKKAFGDGIDIHDYNGRALFGEEYSPKARRKGAKYTMRDEVKRSVHATNYGSSARTLAITLGWSIRTAEVFQDKWLSLHPGIRAWQRQIEYDLQTKRRITNRFGNRIIYLERADNLLPRALAWIPQSTVAGLCSRGALGLSRECPWCEILLQVHDSIVFQIPKARVQPSGFLAIRRALSLPIPYEDPLFIPWELSLSETNWGSVRKVDWKAVT